MIFDITRPLADEIPVYEGDEQYRLQKTRTFERDGYNLSHVTMSVHCGSHIDAPAHFLGGGATVDLFPCEWMIGRAFLMTAYKPESFFAVPLAVTHLLIRSGEGFGGLSNEDARVLIDKGVRVIGTDRLTISPDGLEAQVHRTLLGADVWILENLDLTEPPDGFYELICMPLNLEGAEGAPIRALLRG